MTFRTLIACFSVSLLPAASLVAQVGIGALEYVTTDGPPSVSLTPRGGVKPVQPSKKIHIVQPGESLYGISQRYQVDMDVLKSLNNLQDNVILPNQQLVVGIDGAGDSRGNTAAVSTRSLDAAGSQPVMHAKTTAYETRMVQQTSYEFHEVKEGESLESIADTYGQSVDSLIAWNSVDAVFPMDVIRVRRSDKLIPYAVPVTKTPSAEPRTRGDLTAPQSPTVSLPYSPLDAPASPLDAPATDPLAVPTQNWSTGTPVATTPGTATAAEEEDEEEDETEDLTPAEIPVIRTEALDLRLRGQVSEEEEDDEEEEEDESAARTIPGTALQRNAAPANTRVVPTTTPEPLSPLTEAAPVPDPADALMEVVPATAQPAPAPTLARRNQETPPAKLQGVSPSTLEEGVLETGAFAVLDMPANAADRFVIHHKNLPAGTQVRILLPDNGGYIVAKVAGSLNASSVERFALSPACVTLLRAAGVDENKATLAYK